MNERLIRFKNSMGGIPPFMENLSTHSQQLLDTYLDLIGDIERFSLTFREIHHIMYVFSELHRCDSCAAFHAEVLESTEFGKSELEDKRLLDLEKVARLIFKSKGVLRSSDWTEIKKIGFSEKTIYDIVQLLVTKTISSLSTNISGSLELVTGDSI